MTLKSFYHTKFKHLFLLLVTKLIVWINTNTAFAINENQNIPFEKITILINLSNENIDNKNFICKTLSDLLTASGNAPWGLISASYASCDINDKKLSANSHEMWKLNVVATANKATWTIDRPLGNVPGDDNKNITLAWKTEAIQVLNSSTKVRKFFYTNPKSLTLLIAGIVQQLPFFYINSAINNTSSEQAIALPPFKEHLSNARVCLTTDWKSFSTYLNTDNFKIDQQNLCPAQSTFKVPSITRGSLTEQITQLLAAELDTTKKTTPSKKISTLKPLQFYLGTQAGYGTIKLTTQHINELNKTGTGKFAKIDLGLKYGSTKIGIDVNAGLGANFSNISGTESTIVQFANTSTAFLDFTAHVYLWPGLLLGGIMRNTYGLNATYEMDTANKNYYVLAVGPSVLGFYNFKSWDFLGGIMYLSDINNQKRSVKTLYYSIELNYLL